MQRQMHGRRVLAAAAAAGLIVSLFAPWYRESIVARGLHGLETMTVSSSGWDAFGFTEVVILVVAIVTIAITLVLTPTAGPGGDRPTRIGGVLIALLGAAACLVVIARLSTASGTTRQALTATMVTVRWGLYLALACAVTVTVAGVALARGRRAAAAPDQTRRRAPRQRSEAAFAFAPPSSRTATQRRVRRPEARGQTRPEPAPAPTRPQRRSERQRPPTTSDHARWEEQATSWLDLPE